MINFDFDKRCYGCKACFSRCPNNAISMKKNKEGFEIPYINEEKCIQCGLCDNVCPHINEPKENIINKDDVVKVAYRKNINDFRNYTSSGIFSELSKVFLKNGDYVAGCIWDGNMKAIHVLSNKEDIVKKMAKSKYVQSDMKKIFIEIKDKLENGKKILFSGTPCQVAAVKNYFKNNNLYTVGIVCHGTPSPEVWKVYKESLEDKYNSKMVDANFRYKGKYGWITPFTKYDFENKKSIEKLSFTDDEYVVAFGEDMLHRNTCYTCKYKGTNSNADLIIGDFWGCSNRILKQSKNKGVSAIIEHTNKGKELLEMVQDKFEIEVIRAEDMIKENPPVIRPVKYNNNREIFYERFNINKDVSNLTMGMENTKYKIKKVLYRIFIFEWLKRIKYYIKHK